MISSRKADNVSQTVDDLKKLGIDVQGTVCHVVSAASPEALGAICVLLLLLPPHCPL